MRKILFVTAIGLSLAASTALAAPLDDYSAGKTAIDLGFNWSGKFSTDDGGVNITPAMNAAVTVGLGNKIALQYKYDNWQTKDYESDVGRLQLGYQKHQVNLLYQVAHGISPYIGWRNDRVSLKSNILGTDIEGSGTESAAQLGIIGQYKFAKNKAKVWGDIAFGTKSRQTYEVGLGYEVAKNTDLNITYQYNKVNDFKVYGFTTGVTYKF